MGFLTLILDTIREEGIKQPSIEIIEKSFNKIVSSAGQPKSQVKKSFDEALSTQDNYVKTTREFLNRMGVKEVTSGNGIMFMNGKLIEFNEEKVTAL